MGKSIIEHGGGGGFKAPKVFDYEHLICWLDGTDNINHGYNQGESFNVTGNVVLKEFVFRSNKAVPAYYMNNGYLSSKHQKAVDLSNITISVWFYRTGVSGNGGIWGIGTPSGSATGFDHRFNWSSGNTFSFCGRYLNSNTTIDYVTGIASTERTIYHSVYVVNKESQKLYVNGSLVHSRNSYDYGEVLTTFFRLGATNWDDGRILGWETDFRVYNRPFTDTEVSSLYSTGPQNHLELSQNILTDKLGNAYDTHTLLLIHGNTWEDESMYKHTAITPLRGGASYRKVMDGPFGSSTPVLHFNNAYCGWTNPAVFTRTLDATSGWTFEFWHYKIGSVSSEDLFCVGLYTDGSGNALHNDSTSNYYSYIWRNNAQYSSSTKGPFTTGTWNHVAYVFWDNTLHLFINGVLKETYANNYGNTKLNNGVIFGGYNATSYAGTGINAYLAEVRLSDVARYRNNFTPNSIPFTPYA